jgi:hypothetical protein
MLITHILDFILHLDEHLQFILTKYGTWAYLILFLIIFCENTPSPPNPLSLGRGGARRSLSLGRGLG